MLTNLCSDATRLSYSCMLRSCDSTSVNGFTFDGALRRIASPKYASRLGSTRSKPFSSRESFFSSTVSMSISGRSITAQNSSKSSSPDPSASASRKSFSICASVSESSTFLYAKVNSARHRAPSPLTSMESKTDRKLPLWRDALMRASVSTRTTFSCVSVWMETSAPSSWNALYAPRSEPGDRPSRPASPSRSRSTCSHRNSGRCRLRKIALRERGSLYGEWPIVTLSQVPPKLCMLEACARDSDTVASAEVSAERRPSGRPTSRSAPRTTRCVCRCTRWSAGLPDKTVMPAAL